MELRWSDVRPELLTRHLQDKVKMHVLMVITWLLEGLLASLKTMSELPPPNQGNASPQRQDSLIQELVPHIRRLCDV